MEISAKAIEIVAEEIKKRGTSYEEIAEATLLSKSTISRVVTQHKASSFTLKQLVAYLEIGEKYRQIVGDETDTPSGCQISSDLMEELAAVRAEWSQRLLEVVASYENRINFFRDQLLSAQDERKRERETQDQTYDRTVGHLKAQIDRLHHNNDTLVNRLVEAEKEAKEATQRAVRAEEARKQVEGNRHQVFTFFAVIVSVMAIALIIALRTDRII